MSRAIEQLKSGLTIGHARLGMHGTRRGTVKEQVHDGDTLTVEAIGNLAIRFLGIDAPEVSLPLPDTPNQFIPIDNPAWQAFLDDPFAAHLPPIQPALDPALVQHLSGRVGQGAAANHARHAKAATEALETLVTKDLAELGQDTATFRFFLAFAHEVMEGRGRLLCYLNRDQPSATVTSPRPRSYNERLLQAGWVTPYFIWPNVNPFRRQVSLTAAIPPPGGAADQAASEPSLRDARAGVAQARQDKKGIFEAADPLRLLPFELRYLANRTPPSRWVIDLSRNDDTLIPPQAYTSIALPEDRLFIPAEYVPLFVEAGWRRP